MLRIMAQNSFPIIETMITGLVMVPIGSITIDFSGVI